MYFNNCAKLIYVLGVPIYLAVFCSVVFGYNYAIEGVVGKKYNGKVNTNASESIYTFYLAVRDAQWRIVTMYDDEGYEVTGCDGTNVFEILYDSPAVYNLKTHKPEKMSASNAKLAIQRNGRSAIITKGNQPIDSPWLTQMPWFAFASANFLDQNDKLLLPPWLSVRSGGIANVLTSELTRSRGFPALPERAIFKVSSSLKDQVMKSPYLSIQPANQAMIKSIPKEVSDLEDGQVIGEYIAEAFTNFAGMEIPTAFSIKHYIYSKGNPGRQNAIITIWGKLTKISQVPEMVAFVPEITNRLSVIDKRVQNRSDKIQDVFYVITNNTWPLLSDQIVLNAYEQKTGIATKQRILAINSSRFVFLSLMIVTLCLPFAALIRTYRKQKTKNEA